MKIVYGFFAILASWLIGYLTGSFIAVSFNPADWEPIGRIMIAMIFTFAGVFAFLAVVTQ